MRIFRAPKFQKDPGTILGVGFTRYPVSICFKPNDDYVRTVKKVTKINLRITAKGHAHLQTLTNTHAKFQKDPGQTVGGVTFIRYPGFKPKND